MLKLVFSVNTQRLKIHAAFEPADLETRDKGASNCKLLMAPNTVIKLI